MVDTVACRFARDLLILPQHRQQLQLLEVMRAAAGVFLPSRRSSSSYRSPAMVVTIAQANEMARSVWTILPKQENYERRGCEEVGEQYAQMIEQIETRRTRLIQ
jgi:hypothetical protein